MSDAIRSQQSWDLVLIGCGKSKKVEQARGIDLYTGPVFAAHRDIVKHLDCWPYILSAKHGPFPAGRYVDPYDCTLDDLTAAERGKWNEQVLRLVAGEGACILRDRDCVAAPRDPAYDLPIRERRAALLPLRASFAFGPPAQPSVLVLAGAPYIDGWADRARALGVRVDDPLRGFDLGERRTFARRFVEETTRWHPSEGVRSPDEVGWTRREQLLSFVETTLLEAAPAFPGGWHIEDAPAEPLEQLDLFARSAAA